MAAAYGVRSVKIEGETDLKAKLKAALDADEGMLIECVVAREENVYPMIPAGMTVADMRGKEGVADDVE